MKASVLRQALLICALAFLPAIGQALYFRDKVSWQSPVPPSEATTVEQARAWGEGVLWVDARPEAEFNQDHVPGAILLSEDHWDLQELGGKWSPDKKVVVYCSSHSCNASREVARKLRQEAQLKGVNGENCVFVLEGGWEEWLRDARR